ncbi:MAG: hypothetical protein ACOYT7_00750 [Patescibacteria group bacterium]
MTSLTRVAVTARKAVRYSIFFLIFLIVGKIVFDIGSGIYRRIFPPPPPPPTVLFGKLPSLPFREKEKPNLTFSLETPEGGLPTTASQAKVYFMPELAPNLLSLDVAKDKASSLGFNQTEQEISPTLYQFPHKSTPARLEINIVTGVFSISYDLAADSSPLARRPPAPEVAASNVRSYLSSAGLLPEDLSGPTTHEFLKIAGDKFVSALALSEADLVKVNLFRKSYDDLPSLTAEAGSANVWFLVSGAQEREKQIIAGQFHYFPVDEGKYSTYPLKTSQEAWEEFNAGKYYLATPGLNKDGEGVKIRRIYLAYFDPGTPAEFFQPIFVFEGDRGFIAYLPAVSPEYYGD